MIAPQPDAAGTRRLRELGGDPGPAAPAVSWWERTLSRRQVAETTAVHVTGSNRAAVAAVVEHALRWGTWTELHQDAADAVTTSDTHPIDDPYSHEVAINHELSTIIYAADQLHIVDFDSDHTRQRLDSSVDRIAHPQPDAAVGWTADMLTVDLDRWRHDIVDGVAGSSAAVICRLSATPARYYQRWTAAQNPLPDGFVYGGGWLCDHPNTAELIDCITVPELALIVTHPNSPHGAFRELLTHIDRRHWDTIISLWSTWTGTWGELCGAARQLETADGPQRPQPA